MTIQIKDKILFTDSNEITGNVEILTGSNKILKLESFDNINKNKLDSCHRGYLASYLVIDNKLILNELQINSEYDISMITNNAIKVTQSTLVDFASKYPSYNTTTDKYLLFDDKYSNINLPVNYTGKLLLGHKKKHKSIIASDDSMKYWSNKYRQLIEITLSKGVISSLSYLDENEINTRIKEENNSKNLFYKLKGLGNLKIKSYTK